MSEKVPKEERKMSLGGCQYRIRDAARKETDVEGHVRHAADSNFSQKLQRVV